MKRVVTPARTIIVRLTASWAIAPRQSDQLPSAAATPMLAAAGIVVTEISTPSTAPDLAEVSESIPAVAGEGGDDEGELFRLGDELGERVVVAVEVGGDQAGRLADQGEEEGGGDPDREADRERRQRAQGDAEAALDGRDAEARQRPELRARRPSRR